jgi:hypothetical protein
VLPSANAIVRLPSFENQQPLGEGERRPTMAVVTVSRQLGSHGRHIAEEVAARLSAVCVDKEVLAEMAQREGVSVDMIVQAEARLISRPILVSEEMKSLFAAQARKQGSLGDVNSFVTQLGAAIRALADQDNVVFVGRGTQLLLADYPQALHVGVFCISPRKGALRG